MTDAHDWTGPVGDMWALEWRRTDRSLAALSRRLDAAICAVAPGTGRALDIGCGAGATSLALADVRPEIDLTGVDLSPTLLAIARTRDPGGRIAFLEADVATAGLASSTCSYRGTA